MCNLFGSSEWWKKHRGWIRRRWWKLLSVASFTVGCLGFSSSLFCRVSRDKREWKQTLSTGFYMLKTPLMVLRFHNIMFDVMFYKEQYHNIHAFKIQKLIFQTHIFDLMWSSIAKLLFSLFFYWVLINAPMNLMNVHVVALLCTICSRSSFPRLSLHTQEAGSACCHGAASVLCSDKHRPVTLGSERLLLSGPGPPMCRRACVFPAPAHVFLFA